ncbi:MAG: thioredoxin domain-containing protein, partial [Chloroflexi bacterium]|nr:thioredoxin domain-containing protein [Chloroflexota bacterium]
LQHADNPVDWYPWGEEALERARAEDKPVFLSIGYSSCHWCHVMERESFEDPETARLLNEGFVSIKVDREERPEIDAIYMEAIQAMTGRGGWPLSVFLLPDGRPFFGGTYFPPEDQAGMPGFRRVLQSVRETFRARRDAVAQSAEHLSTLLRQSAQPIPAIEPLAADILHMAAGHLAGTYDAQNGGIGMAPKFPQPMVYEFLLRYHRLTSDAQALEMVVHTLERMAAGGIYDHVGGGFHRYSTDESWLVPHFEKMLYDNALLARLYLHAYQVTGRPLFRRVAEETLDYLLREMRDPSGGFYSAEDADSEGVEGKYYLWSYDELLRLLGAEEGGLFCLYYGVAPEGNIPEGNILHLSEDPQAFAATHALSEEELDARVRQWKRTLREARARRVPPGKDDKVLTAWNGLALRTLAEAANTLGREDYRAAAVACASFLLGTTRQDGRLLRTYRQGQAKLNGYLEDYSALTDGLLALHEATFDPRWLREARGLTDAMLELFWDEGQEALFDTGSDHETLLVRPRDLYDNVLPCGASLATEVLLKMGVLTGVPLYHQRGAASLRSAQAVMRRAPMSAGQWLSALDFYLGSHKEIALIGRWEDPGTQALLEVVARRFLPNKILVGTSPESFEKLQDSPLMEGRDMVGGKPTAFVCENYVCRLPVTDPEALARELDG